MFVTRRAPVIRSALTEYDENQFFRKRAALYVIG
jgi:hypothetical protein